ELARKLGISKNVIFIDGFPYSQIERLYSICDVFVLPSFPLQSWDKTTIRQTIAETLLPSFQFYGWQEQFGYVLVEAMACGKPVISTFCGAIPEVVESGKTSLLTTPGNYHELSEALEVLLGDAKLRQQMGRAGRALAEKKYDSRKVAKQFIEVYKKVLRK
ncbi:MAG: glycosyltransferase, partial [archaeon]|nr:glycosyltransferase [archaeon]